MLVYLLIALTFLMGCAQGDFTQTALDLDLGQQAIDVRFEETHLQSGAVKITLMNSDYGTPRRLEREIAPSLSRNSRPDLESAATLALRAAEVYFPGVSLTPLNYEKGDRFTYVTLEQDLAGHPVMGSRLIMRMNSRGDWVTMTSTLIASDLLQRISFESPSQADWTKFVSQADSYLVLEKKEMVFPRRGETNLEIIPAEQVVLFHTGDHVETWLWIDRQNGELLAIHQPHKMSSETLTLQGSIVPNAPDDKTTIGNFPGASILIDQNKKLNFDEAGTIARNLLTGNQALVKLENAFVSVADNLRKESGLRLNLTQLPEEFVSLDSGTSLEERNIYYWVMKSRELLTKQLKYDGMNYQLVAVANYGEKFDNAFFQPMTKSLSFGAGYMFLKNTALARDVIIHEFGHAVTHQIYGLQGGYEFSAMNEAMSDYLAATITNDPLIADGGMATASGKDYLRRLDNSLVYPKDLGGKKFHEDGQMFGGALWNLRKSLGQELADKMIHEARLAQAKSIVEFYRELLVIDEDKDDLNPLTPSQNHGRIARAFKAHGIGSPNVHFDQKNENLTIPWKKAESQGCWVP